MIAVFDTGALFSNNLPSSTYVITISTPSNYSDTIYIPYPGLNPSDNLRARIAREYWRSMSLSKHRRWEKYHASSKSCSWSSSTPILPRQISHTSETRKQSLHPVIRSIRNELKRSQRSSRVLRAY